LDEAVDQFTRFWTYLVATIQCAHPKAGETTLAMLNASQSVSFDVAIGALINDLSCLESNLVIILDDCQHLHATPIFDCLNFFLDRLPHNTHLVLLSREDLPLALARRRARRQMVEIRANDLRFTMEETTSLLNQAFGLALQPTQVAALDERTEGWVAGIQMAAITSLSARST
jgi:LuxR family maltose regulon positive regulatory protein